MKKCFLLLMVLTLIAGVFISCSLEEGLAEELVYVEFSDGVDRAISDVVSATAQAGEIQPVVDLYWFYTASKVADKKGTVGVTSTETRINGGMGLDGTIGPFSPGVWTFNLYAYKSLSASGAGATQIYKGEATATLTRGADPEKITVTITNSTTTGSVVINDMTFYNGDNAKLYFQAALSSKDETLYSTEPVALTAIAATGDTKFTDASGVEHTAQSGTYYYNVPVGFVDEKNITRGEGETFITISNVEEGSYSFAYIFTNSLGAEVHAATKTFSVFPGGVSTIAGGIYDFSVLPEVTFGVDADKLVANINGSSTTFLTLKDAYSAAKEGDVINLIKDDPSIADITVDKLVTINMNGYTYGGKIILGIDGVKTDTPESTSIIGKKALYNSALYRTLEGAIAALPTNSTTGSATIKLLDDLTYNSTVTFNKAYTLDLNGKTFTSTVADASAFNLTKSLRVIDSSENTTGVISAPNCASEAIVVDGAALTIKQGTVKSNVAIFKAVNEGSITITGGNYVSYNGEGDTHAIASTIEEGSSLLVYGGTFDVDPADPDSKMHTGGYVAKGYMSTSPSTGVYVVEEMPPTIVTLTHGNNEPIDYYDFQMAVDHAEEGDVITTVSTERSYDERKAMTINVGKEIFFDFENSFPGTLKLTADRAKIKGNFYDTTIIGAVAGIPHVTSKDLNDDVFKIITEECMIPEERVQALGDCYFELYSTLAKAIAASNTSTIDDEIEGKTDTFMNYVQYLGGEEFTSSIVIDKQICLYGHEFNFTQDVDALFTVSADFSLINGQINSSINLFKVVPDTTPKIKVFDSDLYLGSGNVFSGDAPSDCLKLYRERYGCQTDFDPSQYLEDNDYFIFFTYQDQEDGLTKKLYRNGYSSFVFASDILKDYYREWDDYSLDKATLNSVKFVHYDELPKETTYPERIGVNYEYFRLDGKKNYTFKELKYKYLCTLEVVCTLSVVDKTTYQLYKDSIEQKETITQGHAILIESGTNNVYLSGPSLDYYLQKPDGSYATSSDKLFDSDGSPIKYTLVGKYNY